MSRSSVVLPQPLGPSSTTVSPSATISEARSTATTSPNPMTTSSISSFAIDPGLMRRCVPMIGIVEGAAEPVKAGSKVRRAPFSACRAICHLAIEPSADSACDPRALLRPARSCCLSRLARAARSSRVPSNSHSLAMSIHTLRILISDLHMVSSSASLATSAQNRAILQASAARTTMVPPPTSMNSISHVPKSRRDVYRVIVSQCWNPARL